MTRDLATLSRRVYDVLIVGGGIYGVWMAWDAALRGLSVALLDKGDFGHATSSNSLRIIHGGLRYLQHGDIRRMRRSIYERKVLMRIAPHLVRPLPFLVPTYGHTMRGKSALSLALLLNALIGFDRNRGQDPQHSIPWGRVLSRRECLRLFPGLQEKGLTGGAIFYDGQVTYTERLILSVARSAARAGADLANYVEVIGLLSKGGRVTGATARDALTGDQVEVRANVVVNASGPWLDQVLGLLDGHRPTRHLPLSKAFNLLVTRQLIPHCAVGVYAKGPLRDRDAFLNRGERLLFITPWQGRSLIGTAHLPYDADPSACHVTEAEIEGFLDEINAAYPPADLTREDVCMTYSGLLPIARDGIGSVQLAKRHQMYDHRAEGGGDGLISVVGVKLTEARSVAQEVIDLVCRKLGRTAPESATATTPLHGGQIEQLSTFVSEEMASRSLGVQGGAARDLLRRYGSEYPRVLTYLDEAPVSTAATASPPCSAALFSSLEKAGRGERLSVEGDGTRASDDALQRLLKAEVRHGVREEMAQKLADAVFRRTTLGIGGDPGDACLTACAVVMASELGWDAKRTQREVEEVTAILSRRT